MAYVLIYDPRRWVRSDSTDVTIVLPIVAGGTGNTSGTATVNANLTGPITSVGNATSVASQTGTGSTFVMSLNPTIGAGGTGTNTSTLSIDGGSGAGGFPFLVFKRNSVEKAGLAVSGGVDFFIPGTVANDLAIRTAQKILISADGGVTAHVSIDPTGVLAMLNAPLNLRAYTVATLPAGVRGYMAYCTDLLAPTYLAVAVGGGGVIGPVFHDGANWITV